MISKILYSFCCDCTDLIIEITYSGLPGNPQQSIADVFLEKMVQAFAEHQAKVAFERDWLPKLAWMKYLKSLVLIKLGPGATSMAGSRVISILLDSLTCRYLFPRREKKQTLRPLERLWIQGFETHRCAALQYSNPETLQSYLSGDCDVKDAGKYESFPTWSIWVG